MVPFRAPAGPYGRRAPAGPSADRGAPARRPGDGRSRPARTRVLAVAAVLAAVVGLAGLVTALGRSGSSSQKTSAVASEPRSPEASQTTLAGPAPATPAGAGHSAAAGEASRPSAAAGPVEGGPVVDGPDLGQLNDPTTLTQQLTAIVATVLQRPGAAANPTAGETGPVAQPCTAQGVASAGLTGQAAVLRYVATLRYQGVDAVVLIYARPGGWTAVVLRTADCGGLLVLPSV